MSRFLKYMLLTPYKKGFNGIDLGLERFCGLCHVAGRIATIGFTLILASIQKEVESRESIDYGSSLGVFLPGRPGEMGLF